MFGGRGESRSTSGRPLPSQEDENEEDITFTIAARKELAAQKFDEWVRFKDSFDRGLSLFAKLDSGHCEVPCAK